MSYIERAVGIWSVTDHYSLSHLKWQLYWSQPGKGSIFPIFCCGSDVFASFFFKSVLLLQCVHMMLKRGLYRSKFIIEIVSTTLTHNLIHHQFTFLWFCQLSMLEADLSSFFVSSGCGIMKTIYMQGNENDANLLPGKRICWPTTSFQLLADSFLSNAIQNNCLLRPWW